MIPECDFCNTQAQVFVQEGLLKFNMFLIDYLVQSDHDNQIEDPIKKLEWKKKDGDHVHEHEDYEFRL